MTEPLILESPVKPEAAKKVYFKLPVSLEAIVLGFIVFLGCLFRLINGPRTIDDAYITYRYVENIVNGNGFVYNAGEHVLGTTTPLYTILLSLLYFIIRIDLPWLSLIINTLADAVTIVLLWRISNQLLARLKVPKGFEFAPSLLFSMAVLSTNWCIGGMETSVFSLILISGLYFLTLRNKEVFATVAAGLAFLCRPEGIVLLGLVLGYILVFQKKKFIRALLAAIIVIAPWLLFATFYFGNPIPQSVLAKTSAIYVVENNFFDNFSYFLELLIDNPIGHLIGIYYFPNGKGTVLVFLTVINIPLFVYGTLTLFKLIDRKYLLIPGFAFAFIGIYALSIYKTPAFLFPWYTGPVVPWLLLLLNFGLAGIWKQHQKLPKFTGKIVHVLVVLFIIIAVINQLHGYNNGRSYMTSRGYYEQAVNFLQPYLKKGDVIAAAEIGELGYFSHARIIDTVGLVSPEALNFYPVPENERWTNNTIPTKLIMKYSPDYVISLDAFMKNSLLKSPEFLNDYTLLKSWPNQEFGSTNLDIYIRNSSANKK